MSDADSTELKIAITKLTTIQEGHNEQMKELIKNGKIILSLVGSVEDHGSNIVEIYKELNILNRRISVEKEEITKSITDMRTSITRASYGRLGAGLMISFSFAFGLFEFHHARLNKIEDTKTDVIHDIAVLKEDYKHLHEHIKVEK